MFGNVAHMIRLLVIMPLLGLAESDGDRLVNDDTRYLLVQGIHNVLPWAIYLKSKSSHHIEESLLQILMEIW